MKWQRYSSSDLAYIREHWPDVQGIAAALNRTRAGITMRGLKLGLPCPSGCPKRPFTEAEVQAVRDRYAAEGPVPLAREMGRKPADIVGLAGRLGVHCWTHWTREEDQRLIDLCQRKLTNREIAAALGRSIPSIGKRKQALGLTVALYNPEARRRQLITLHQASNPIGSEVRWARERLALGEHGWPPDLNPKEIAILNSLQANGPQNRRTLAKSIGEPMTRRRVLSTHGGTSAMSRLLARGLVTRCRLRNGRKCIVIYTLTAFALANKGKHQSVESFNAPIARRGRQSADHVVEPRSLEKAS